MRRLAQRSSLPIEKYRLRACRDWFALMFVSEHKLRSRSFCRFLHSYI